MVAAPLVSLLGCKEHSCNEYTRFTRKLLETQTFNVHFYELRAAAEPNELFLGTAIGLQQCEAVAWNAAEARKKDGAVQ